MIAGPTLALSITLTLAAGNPAPASAGHQLLCSEISAGHVVAQSQQHQLQTVVAWSHGPAISRTEGHLLVHGCSAWQFRSAIFDALFHDRFGH